MFKKAINQHHNSATSLLMPTLTSEIITGIRLARVHFGENQEISSLHAVSLMSDWLSLISPRYEHEAFCKLNCHYMLNFKRDLLFFPSLPPGGAPATAYPKLRHSKQPHSAGATVLRIFPSPPIHPSIFCTAYPHLGLP